MRGRTLIRTTALFAALALGVAPVSIAAQTAHKSAAPASPEIYQPKADPHAIVVSGHARFTVLTPQLIRMEWAADGKFEDHASFAFLNRKLSVPEFKVGHADSGKTLSIQTPALELTYIGDDKFNAENLHITLKDLPGKSWHPGMTDTGNLMGTTRTLDKIKGSDVKLETGLISRDGWTLVDDSERPLFDSADFSMSKGMASKWPWILQRPAGERLDWYFFGYGHDYHQALGDFVKVAGRIPLPPRYAFGTWWSRYWAYSDQELDELVKGYRERNIPLDVFVIDMDWHLAFRGNQKDQAGERKGWSGYTWNRNLFPEPEKFLRSLHDRGLKVTLNLHPASGVQPWEEAYPAMARAMGQDPSTGKYVPFKITDRKYVENYFKILHHPLEKQGVDFWWLDWQQHSNTDIAGVNPTFWLNYLHFTDQEREGKRPLLFHRWGGLGNHRYQIGFSGDTISVWPSLAFQPSFTSTAANVGYAYWSHDIGGHMPGAVEPELYTRWLQFGMFSPILRTHTTKNPDAERRVWAYPEPYSDVMVDTLRQRYAWIPYIYTEARRTYDTGVAFLRPLYYDWPETDDAYKAGNEYLFGDKVIVAPVTTPVDTKTGVATENIWLPEGDWVEGPTGSRFKGPQHITREFSLEQVPVYYKAGAIVPMQPPMLYTGQKPVDPLIVRVLPLDDGQKSDYSLYEDSSQGRKYMTGEFARTELSASRKANVVTVKVAAAKGHYPGMVTHRALQIELPGDWPPSSVTVNGRPLKFVEHAIKPGWRFEGNTFTTVILTDPIATSVPATVVVTRDPALVAKSQLVDGFAGKMVYLRRAYAEMNDVWPLDDLVAAMQTGNRLGYHPDHALQEVEHLPTLIQSAQKSLDQIAEEQKKHNIQVGQNNSKDKSAIEKRRRENEMRIVRAQNALASAAK